MTAEIGRPAAGETALCIVDMINPFDFEGSQRLEEAARKVAVAIARLRNEADALGVPVVYINDNFGQWHSERSRLVEHCRNAGGASEAIAGRLAPRDNDYFVIKPQFSGFYSTNLPVLLPKLGATRLVLTGISADICVLFTAADAHMRDYALWAPEDAVASLSDQRTSWALEIMASSMKADTRTTHELTLAEWIDAAPAAASAARNEGA